MSGAGAAFYCVADARFFLGAVGLVNSLRLVGHDEPVYLLDLGLTGEQRRLMADEVTLVEGPRGTPPWLAKTIAPLRHPSPTAILIDADMVATRHLGDPVERAASGAVVAFRNDRDRFVAGWGELLDLGPIERAPYVSSGLVLLGGAVGRRVLELLDDRQRRVEIGRTAYGNGDEGYAFRYPEQDVLNAILDSLPDQGAVVRLDARLAPVPPFGPVRVVDERALRCAFADGTEPYVLHQIVRKPWLERIYDSPYSRLLRRLLVGDDVAIRVPVAELPTWLRPGIAAGLERRLVNALDLARYGGERAARRLAWARRSGEEP